jgi:hypothetical protein
MNIPEILSATVIDMVSRKVMQALRGTRLQDGIYEYEGAFECMQATVLKIAREVQKDPEVQRARFSLRQCVH